MMPECFYHIKPDKMIGKMLMPLATLATEAPELANEYAGKYKARSETKNKEIDVLDCNWEDVLFMSCLDPGIIFRALQLLGLYTHEDAIKVFKFPIKVLKGMEWCWYQEEGKKERFKLKTTASYKEEKTLPKETMRYFLECAVNGKDPLVFSGVPHLLVKGEIDTKFAETLVFRPHLPLRPYGGGHV